MAETDLISKQDIIKWFYRYPNVSWTTLDILNEIENIPTAESEPLTDKEQRIFLAAMGREMKICEEVDRNYVREPYEDSLVKVCREIERKVKSTLWT